MDGSARYAGCQEAPEEDLQRVESGAAGADDDAFSAWQVSGWEYGLADADSWNFFGKEGSLQKRIVSGMESWFGSVQKSVTMAL